MRAGSDEGRLWLLDREVIPPPPDEPLIGTAWELDGFLFADADGVFVPLLPTTVLRFSRNGDFATTMGCPLVSGRYERVGNMLTLLESIHRLDECPEEWPSAVEHATSILSDGFRTVTIRGRSMNLMRGAGGMRFTAVSEGERGSAR